MKAADEIIAGVNNFSDGMARRKISTFSAAGAYYLFMSLVPMVMLLCAVMQYTPLTEEIVMDALAEYVPASLYHIVEWIVATIYSGGGAALTISVVLTIWSASKSMKAMMRGMDAAYGVERKENYFIFSLRACLYMLVFVAVIILSLIVLVYGGKILGVIRYFLPGSAAVDYIFGLLRYLRFMVVMALLALVFMFLFRWMPALKLRYRYQWPGAVFAAIVWVIFSSFFSLYISMSNRFGAYGLVGTIVVAMMWIYFCIYFLLIGGYINHYFYEKDSPSGGAKPEKAG
jgi:membrane protein